MRAPAAALASAVHYVLAPGVVVGLIPYALSSGWEAASPTWPPMVIGLGVVLTALGVLVVTAEFVRFVREGGGSPAPVAPTERLVTGGLYRYVRNPMYVGVVTAIVGQAMLLSSSVLLGYAAVAFLTVATFVHGYEEPTLLDTYGTEYADYCADVPRWIPRLRPAHRASKAR